VSLTTRFSVASAKKSSAVCSGQSLDSSLLSFSASWSSKGSGEAPGTPGHEQLVRVLCRHRHSPSFKIVGGIVYAVDDDASLARLPTGDAIETFIRREDGERFIEEVRGDEPEAAAKLRIEERTRGVRGELKPGLQLRDDSLHNLPVGARDEHIQRLVCATPDITDSVVALVLERSAEALHCALEWVALSPVDLVRKVVVTEITASASASDDCANDPCDERQRPR
jgi:hypothetical protein